MEKYISQENFSYDFNTELIKKVFKGIRKAKYNDKWYFVVDVDEVDLDELRLGVISNEKEKFIDMISFIECENFDKFHQMVANEMKFTPKNYVVIGDIVNKYASDGKNYISFDFVDKHNIKQSFPLFITKSTRIITKTGEEKDWREIENCRIKAYITCSFNPERTKINLNATEVQVLGPCSREAEYHDLYQKYKEYIKVKNSALTLEVDKPKIALISGNNHGRHDFLKSLQKHLCDIKLVDTNMTNINDIIDKIEKINQEGNADIICIVRGGGDPEDMCIYNSAELVEAIIHSKIPIVTGIGHKNDELLSEMVAYGQITPTAAGNYIQNIIYKRKRKIKETLPYGELLKEYNKLEHEYDSLKAHYEALQEETKKKKKGFFARLFGF